MLGLKVCATTTQLFQCFLNHNFTSRVGDNSCLGHGLVKGRKGSQHFTICWQNAFTWLILSQTSGLLYSSAADWWAWGGQHSVEPHKLSPRSLDLPHPQALSRLSQILASANWYVRIRKKLRVDSRVKGAIFKPNWSNLLSSHHLKSLCLILVSI